MEPQPPAPPGGDQDPQGIRARGGEVALGHANANITQVYAERDLAKAVEVARRIG